jgi:phosphoglycolate phosphatase
MAFMPPIRAVAIDLDGTLLDTVDEIARATNAMLERVGDAETMPVEHHAAISQMTLRALPEAVVRNLIGKGIANLVTRTLAAALGREPSAALADHALTVYQECYLELLGTTSVPYDGVIEGLDRMHAMGLKVACITNKATRFSLPLLERTNLLARFEHIVCGDTYEKKKPDPLPLLKTAERFGISPAALVMIGDSANDVQAARAAGCPVLCVPYGYNEGQPVESLDFDGMIRDLSEACAWIDGRSFRSSVPASAA